MNRRRFLASGGVLLAGLVAGCPAGSDAEEPTPAATPTPPPSPTPTPTPPPEGDDTATPESTPAGTATPTTSGTATPVGTPTPTPSVELRQAALAAYRAGFADRESYDRATKDARIGYNQGRYEGAAIRYGDAVDSAQSSVDAFDRAGERAGEAGMADARAVARNAIQYTERYLVPFAELGVDAARAAQRGNFGDAGDLVGEMEALASEARESSLNTAHPAVFEDELGL